MSKELDPDLRVVSGVSPRLIVRHSSRMMGPLSGDGSDGWRTHQWVCCASSIGRVLVWHNPMGT